ncbi:Bacteroides conjugative transposon TraN protein [Chitinophaga eiseniae]|uniref:Bacteroides conjugative transposon TraN protein n=1 Tax=Chitinophaga eiseniae TaxID=634771 RepID=A0A1T4SY01_9BACT|nr:conjugative transposon protein TraN [Chitinophaga eiseniae]SKA33124.1 Bacteroides conjugative transposon TraN protein [Chitinophaga eiseniae]
MSAILRIFVLIAFPALSFGAMPLQDTIGKSRMMLASIPPYRAEVTYDKTSHFLFPAPIKYVDIGSEFLSGGIAEDAGNLLRLKAAVQGFVTETNFSVVTEDGRFYNFNVTYNSAPTTTSYDLERLQRTLSRQESNDVLFDELGVMPPSLADLLMETIWQKNRRAIRHIGARSYGIHFRLKGLCVQDGKYFFHTEVRNRSNVPFRIDFINFKIADKKLVKRTAVQQRLLKPSRMYRTIDEVPGKSTERNVFLLDQFTLTDDKVLLIELYERNGGRHQVLQVENSDLVAARLISNMHLKIR